MTRQPCESDPVQPPTEAAVLVPVHRDAEGELRLVIVRRGEGGAHGGELALPGGVAEADDGSLLETALREAHEEIGLDPERAQVLGELTPVETRTTGYRIVPFLARIAPPEVWRVEAREIAEVLDVPVAELARPGAHHPPPPGAGGADHGPFYQVGPFRLWGATYRIVHPLVERLLAGEWEV